MQKIKFILAGILGFVIHSALFYLFSDLIGFGYYLSAGTSGVLKTVYEFVINKYWTFESKGSKNVGQQAGEFTAMIIVLSALHFAFLSIVVKFTRVPFLISNLSIMALLGVGKFVACRIRIFSK